jgi:Ran GTPase-activating protein (RanGAP) involved in mRNA processing and transport
MSVGRTLQLALLVSLCLVRATASYLPPEVRLLILRNLNNKDLINLFKANVSALDVSPHCKKEFLTMSKSFIYWIDQESTNVVIRSRASVKPNISPCLLYLNRKVRIEFADHLSWMLYSRNIPRWVSVNLSVNDDELIKAAKVYQSNETVRLDSLKVNDYILHEAAIAIAEIIDNAQEITELDLSATGLWREDVLSLVLESIAKNRKINHLDLSCNQIENDSAISIASILKGSNIRYLNLWKSQIRDDGFKAIIEAASVSKVESLDFGYGKFRFNGEWLAKTLEHSNLSVLKLDVCLAMADQIVNEITHLLRSKTRLKTLIIEGNGIHSTGAKILSQSLKSNTHLLHLDISNNYIGDSGAVYLADAIKHTRLTTLNVRNNFIGDSGGMAIAKALKNSTLCRIYLKHNNIGVKSISAFHQAMKTNPRIIELEVQTHQFESFMAWLSYKIYTWLILV